MWLHCYFFKQKKGKIASKIVWRKTFVCICLHSLNAKRNEGNSHHQQVQEVEVVPTECTFMEEGSICCHLARGQKKLEEIIEKKNKNDMFYPLTQIASHSTFHRHTYSINI